MPMHRWLGEGDTMNEQQSLIGDERGGAGADPVSRQRWRTILAVVLIVVGCVLAPLAGVAVWARNQVTNTDRYVRTVAPLASDPAIQQAIADQITTQIFTYLDVRGLTTRRSTRSPSAAFAPRSPTSSAGSPDRWPAASKALSAPRSTRSSRAKPSPTPGSRPTGSPTRHWSRP